MNGQAAFARLIEALSPWTHQLVFIGGWAHRLYRLHPTATVPAYEPLMTLDADVAFAQAECLEGNLRTRLLAAGFQQQLTGDHLPPVSRYTLGEDARGGFYAEFLTPLTGREFDRHGRRVATVAAAGITAQRLRHLDLLVRSPWNVTLGEAWGAASPLNLRIPNPVSFVVQKLLSHDERAPRKRAQDVLYIHDTLELFAPKLGELATLWQTELRATLRARWLERLDRKREALFGALNDTVRDAAAIPPDRHLDPERVRAMCSAALEELLG